MVFTQRIIGLFLLAAMADGSTPPHDECNWRPTATGTQNGVSAGVGTNSCFKHYCPGPQCQELCERPQGCVCTWVPNNTGRLIGVSAGVGPNSCIHYCPGEQCRQLCEEQDCKKPQAETNGDPPDPMTTASASGDPHLTTWGGEKYDYHGACDLVLFKDPNFADGLGLTIHIRTEGRNWWSFIKTALVQIGDDTLEVMGGTDSISYWMNGGDKKEVQTGDASLGDFPLHFRRINGHQTSARIDLGHGDAIAVETFKDFVRVNIKNASNKAFVGAAGLLGAFPHGAKVARDGVTVMEDINAFGQEWQVGVGEPMLFHEVGPVQAEEECAMPVTTTSKERRLGEALIKEEDAALACARVSEGDRDACIFDVMATQDKDMAGSY